MYPNDDNETNHSTYSHPGSGRKRIKVRKKRRKKKHLGLKIFLGLVLLLVLATGAVVGKVYFDAKNAIAQTQTSKFKTLPVTLSKTTAFSTLLLGTSKVDGKDVIAASLAVSINPNTQKTTAVNIDPSKTLPDGSTLTQTYQEGGDTALQDKMQALLGLTFNKVIVFKLDGLGDFVEATGGVTLQNPKAFTAGGYKFGQGSLQLTDKKQTEAYLSLVDASDTTAMAERRRNVAMAVFENLKKTSSVQSYQKILNAISNNTQTNLSFSDFVKIALDYRSSLSLNKMNVHSTTDEATGTQIISQTELDSIKGQFLKTLE
ncbi:MAG: LCP family protein [Streptococcaceae bacterium]|jgi:anionic cell wall polymer biosynthesis LytR-Cps2A-Psr (LCP) family protein|nr:LCP family protein [Streptococcaceae bacterium]